MRAACQVVAEGAFESASSKRVRPRVFGWFASSGKERNVATRMAAELREGHSIAPPESDSVAEAARRALEAVQSLPEAYRETLILRLVEGMSGEEIAARTGLSPGSVRVNLHRGMKMLREKLGEGGVHA
jgi:RNA polymerase sigma-70 factor, ECF subfamily